MYSAVKTKTLSKNKLFISLVAVVILALTYASVRYVYIVEGYCWETKKKYSEEDLLKRYLVSSKIMPTVAQSALDNFPNCCKLHDRPLILRESNLEVKLNALIRGKYFYGVSITGVDKYDNNQLYRGRSDISSCGDMMDLDPSYNKVTKESFDSLFTSHTNYWKSKK